jgi:hypothetical protein
MPLVVPFLERDGNDRHLSLSIVLTMGSTRQRSSLEGFGLGGNWTELVRSDCCAVWTVSTGYGASESIEEIVQTQFECLSDPLQSLNADFLFPVLQFGQMLARQLCMIRQHGLCPPAFRSQDADSPSDPNTDVLGHTSSVEARSDLDVSYGLRCIRLCEVQ